MSVALYIKKLQQDFLWGDLGDGFKYHLVGWREVCVPIPSGGLGICDLALFNQGLLGKWLWRFAMERDALWGRVVVARYGSVWAGALSLYRGLMEFAFGKVLGRGGTLFSILLDLRWEMDPLLNFGIIHGLGGSL